MKTKSCRIYVYKVKKISSTLTEKYLMDTFKENNFRKNSVLSVRGKEYGASLIFMEKTPNNGLAFTFTKINDRKQEFIELDESILDKFKRKIFGDKNLKPIIDSYFIYYPGSKVIFGLYNYESLKHIIGDLEYYLDKHLSIDKSCQFDLMKNTEKIAQLIKDVKYINRIIIKTAIADIDDEEAIADKNPFSKMEKYNKCGHRILEFNTLKKFRAEAVGKITDVLKTHKKAESIYVTGDNINGDILGKLLLHKPCKMTINSDDKFDFEDFVKKAETFYSEIDKEYLKNYSDD
ncbi:MAG: hypothetical protein ACP5N1_03435 [Candidatus Woesearchaeota archaeon]